MVNYSIKDLERISGIKAHTIRIWEQRYNMLTPERSETNIRSYSDTELKKLLSLTTLIEEGYKVSKLSKLSQEEIKEELVKIEDTSKQDVLEKIYIDRFIEHTLDFDEKGFNHSFSHCVLKFGLEETFLKIMYPLLRKLGFLWGINDIYPAQEHFISSLIKRKLLVAIDGMYNTDKDSKDIKTLLYLPEDEQHEIALLLAFYILKKRKHHIIYLGADVPYDNLKPITESKNIGSIVTFFINPQNIEDLNKYIEKLERDFPEIKVFVSGSHNDFLKPQKKSNVHILESPLDLMNLTLLNES